MRITENLLMNGFLQRTARSLSAMTKAQQQISSGKLLERPSDDPIALARSLALRSDLKRVEAYSDKVSSATAFISTTEGSLQEVSDLLSRAKELLIEATNAPSEGVAAGAHSQELRSMIDELLLVANRDIGGRYLFAGRQTSERPYAKIGQSIAYQGDGQDVLEEIGPGLRVALNMTGPAAFQTVPSRIEGSVDLDPAISEITPLRDLFQGNGAAAGPIQITDSNGVVVNVDLSGAETVGDVIDGINASGSAVVASLSPDGKTIELTDTAGGSTMNVVDSLGGDLAQRLGIAGDSDTGSIRSRDLDPALTPDTPAALLLNGAGVPAGAWTIRNAGEEETLTGTIDPSGINTVQDLIDLVAGASTPDGRNLGVRASLVEGKLVIGSIRPHTTLSISDAGGGTSALALGFSGVGEAKDVFRLLEEAATAVDERDTDTLNEMIRSFTDAIERTAGIRGAYGARARQVLQVGENLANQNVDLTIRLSDVEDADLARAAVELAKSEAVYNASLATGTRLLSLSLFNYIR